MPRTPSGVAKTATPSCQPSQRQRVRKVAPCDSSRRVQARNRREAFISRGKTRPELPVNTAIPSPSAQWRTSSGPQAARNGASQSAPSV